MLRIILRNDELEVLESRTQFTINSPTGRHVRFDVRARLGNGELCDIEFQNADDGFLPYRAEFNLALLNSSALEQGQDFDKLPQTYVIFITRKDTYKEDEPYYQFSMMNEKSHKSMGGFSHIIFVNGAYADESNPFGKLAHDLKCTDPKDMYYSILSEKASSFKNLSTEEGDDMCQKVQEYAQECAREASIISTIQTSIRYGIPEESVLQDLEKTFALSPEECREYIDKACEKISA